MAKTKQQKNRWELLAKFSDWLFDGNLDEPLPEEVLKVLNHKILTTAFMKNKYFRQYMNQFNNFNIYSIPIEDLAKFIKSFVIDYNIPKRDLWWFSNLEWKERLDMMKLTKSYERQFIADMLKEGRFIDDGRYGTFRKVKPKPIKKDKVKKEQKQEVDNTTKIKIIDLHKQMLDKKYNSCSSCSLFNEVMVTFDTNVDTVQDIDVMFVAEAPGETETIEGVPLVGKAGQVFRRYLNQLLTENPDIKYIITNTVLCRPPNNRTPTKQEIKECSTKYLDELIDMFNPKLIVALGSTPMYKFTGKDSGITKNRGLAKYKHTNGKEYDVFITVHPSYILRNPNNSYIYDEDFQLISNHIGNGIQTKKLEHTTIHTSNMFSIKIPEKYYTDYNLVNIFTYGPKVIYKFRHKKFNTVEYYESDYFYYYIYNNKGKHVLYLDDINKNDLQLVEYANPTYHSDYGTLYEADIGKENRHSIDYYYQLHLRNLENEYQPRICYTDIEVLADKFPKPEDANYPITLISCKYDTPDDTRNVCYVLGDKLDLNNLSDDEYLNVIKKYDIYYFDNEEKLILKFIEDLHKYDIDIITAWNISFDLGYIINRARKLGISTSLLSPVRKEPYVDLSKHLIKIPGLVILDMLTLYKHITYGNRESYSLDYIVQYEGVNEGEGKKFKGSKFYDLWMDHREFAIAYNMEDVELIKKLDDKLSLIQFANEFRNTTKVPFEHIFSTAKTSDSIIMYVAKLNNILIRNRYSHSDTEKDPKVGAYVYPPKKGIHLYVFEADFASLYPSIIQTFNISPTTYKARFKNGLEDVMKYLNDNIPSDYEFTIIEDPIYNPTPITMTKQEVQEYIDKNDYILSFGGGIFCKYHEEKSILATVIEDLKIKRKYYKKLYAETDEYKYYLIQLAYKIALNSLYGYLGFEGSRFKHNDLVNNVTLNGQIINKFCSLSFNKIKDILGGQLK